ncbi:MAG: cupin domain-containing protein [Elusimicrobia bacterium]|nr:cupin domain-containing protein [Elusimicrobiota bacterium]
MSGEGFHDDPSTWPKGPLVPLEAAHADDRGAIQPLVERLMRSAQLISSKKGVVRANHYHKTDWHYCYMVSGSMEYYERPADSKDKPSKILVKAGQLVFTPPLVEHAMKFLEDTVWLTLSRNPRDQDAYEADVVRVRLI